MFLFLVGFKTLFDIYASFDKWVIKSVSLYLKSFPAGFQEGNCERNNFKNHLALVQMQSHAIINIRKQNFKINGEKVLIEFNLIRNNVHYSKTLWIYGEQN